MRLIKNSFINYCLSFIYCPQKKSNVEKLPILERLLTKHQDVLAIIFSFVDDPIKIIQLSVISKDFNCYFKKYKKLPVLLDATRIKFGAIESSLMKQFNRPKIYQIYYEKTLQRIMKRQSCLL